MSNKIGTIASVAIVAIGAMGVYSAPYALCEAKGKGHGDIVRTAVEDTVTVVV